MSNVADIFVHALMSYIKNILSWIVAMIFLNQLVLFSADDPYTRLGTSPLEDFR